MHGIWSRLKKLIARCSTKMKNGFRNVTGLYKQELEIHY